MSHAIIQALSERRQNIWHETKALLDTAAAEGRDLTAEEAGQYEARSADLTALRARIDLIEKSMQENRSAEEALTRLTGSPEERQAPEAQNLENEFRAMARGERRSVEISAEAMRPAWSARALSKGTATAGGNTVPTSFRDQLVKHLVAQSGLLRLGPTVLNTSSGESIEVPVTTSHGAAGIVAEAGSIAGSSTDPAFAKRTLLAYKYGQIITVARELVEDTAVDLLGYIAESAGRNVGLAFGTHLITGDGSSKPTGIVTTAGAGVTGANSVAGVFTADNLIDLYYSVIAPYRNSPSCGWLMRDATMGAVRKLKDGASQYIFSPGLGIGAPDTILGKPVETDPNVAAVAAAAESVVFGDFSRYFVRLAGGVRFERSDEYAFDNDQVAFRTIMRGDGLLVDQTGAVKTFTGGSA